MPKLGHAVGVSYIDEGGGRFRVRWRQWEEQPDGSRVRKQRSVFAYSMDEVRQLGLDIEKALRERGWWEPPDAPVRPAELNLERVALDWLKWKVGVRAVKPNTRSNLAGSMKRWFTTLRRLHGIAATAMVPGSLMTEEQLVRAQEAWRKPPYGYAEGTIYQTVAAVVDMWTWAADAPAYAALPKPPYNLERVMPRPPAYEAPAAVPTWAECDAVIRRVRLPKPLGLAILMRYTGLRLEQAAQVHGEDLDPATGTLLIRKGKSRREQGLMRRVPISPHLLVDIGPWANAAGAGPLFPDLKATDDEGRPVPIIAYRNQTRYVTEAWQAATEAKEARLEAWSPPSRHKNRPDHAFRAAFQAELEKAGFSERVVDWLVGHAPKTTRGRHYASPDEGVLRRAVAAIPAVDWGEARGNVVEFG